MKAPPTRATARFTVRARGRTADGAWVDLARHWGTAPEWSVNLVRREAGWRVLSVDAPPPAALQRAP